MTSSSQAVTIKGLRKQYPGADAHDAAAEVAVQRLDLTIHEGEFFSIVGPSGCGKTTTLRCIAGLETVDEGQITLYDKVVNDSETGLFIPPEKRQIAFVFQSYAIWPHMTVFENVAFPLRVVPRRYRMRSGEIVERVQDALERVELGAYAKRRPVDLSGGQQQRVALARAVVTDPQLLLLDEPLSNLDARLKERMKFELRELQMRLGVTTINVTHDQAEALAVSDRIAVLDHGLLMQLGTPSQLYFEPKSRFVARFVSRANTAAGTVRSTDQRGRIVVELDRGADDSGITVVARGSDRDATFAPGERVSVAIRPESLRVEVSDRTGHARSGLGARDDGAETENVIAAAVSVIGLSDGGSLEARMSVSGLPGVEWTVRWPTADGSQPAPGTPVTLRVKVQDCLVVADDDRSVDGEGTATGSQIEESQENEAFTPRNDAAVTTGAGTVGRPERAEAVGTAGRGFPDGP